MKRLVSLLLALMLCVGLSACGSSGQPEAVEYADESFVKDLSKGLESRWDTADIQEAKNLNPESKEYAADLLNVISKETDIIAKYRDAKFENGHLQEACISYLNILEESAELAPTVSVDYYSFSDQWNALQAERSKLIRRFVEEFGLTVDAAHQDDLDSFISEAKAIAKKEEQDGAINSLLTGLVFELSESSYGYKTYKTTLTNTAGVDFDHISLEIDLIDENGTIIDQTYASTGSLANGKSIILEFMTDKVFTKYEITPSYYLQ